MRQRLYDTMAKEENKKLSRKKCAAGIISALALSTVSTVVISRFGKYIENRYMQSTLASLIDALLLIAVIVLFGQGDKLRFTFRSFGKGLVVGGTMTAASLIMLTINTFKGITEIGTPRIGAINGLLYSAALFLSVGMTEELMYRGVIMNFVRETMGEGKKALKIFIANNLRIALATDKIPVSEIPGHINKETLAERLVTLHNTLKRDFFIDNPRIAVLALNPPTFIAQLMGISWGALAGAFLAPFMYGLYSKRVTRISVWASFVVGVGITVANVFIKFIASPINAGALAMIAGLVVVPIVSLVTPKMDQKYVDDIFSCYDETVTVHKSHSLDES